MSIRFVHGLVQHKKRKFLIVQRLHKRSPIDHISTVSTRGRHDIRDFYLANHEHTREQTKVWVLHELDMGALNALFCCKFHFFLLRISKT